MSANDVGTGAASDSMDPMCVLLCFTFTLCVSVLAFRLCVGDDFKVESHSGSGLQLFVVHVVGGMCGWQEEATSSGSSSAEDYSTVLFGGFGVGECFLNVLLDECGSDFLLARLCVCGGSVVDMGAGV